MSTVDCQECSKNFPTFKLYIKHLLTKECQGKQNPEENTSIQSEKKRLKVSPKHTQKKKQNEPDSTTADDQFVVSGEPVYVPVKIGTEPVNNLEQTMKKTIMQNMHPNKVARQDGEDIKISPMSSLSRNQLTPHQMKATSSNIKHKSKKSSPAKQQTAKQATPVPSKPGKIACTLCSKLVKSRGMTQHLNMQHKCKYCAVMVENVDEHIKELHERDPCEYCDRKFENEAAVDKHIEVVHLQTCDKCNEEFFSEDSLQGHVVDVHESEECDICNIKFLIVDKMMDEHKDKVHGIKTKTIKQFGGGMMFMMVSD